MVCTRCREVIAKGSKYYRTKRGPHHAACSSCREVIAKGSKYYNEAEKVANEQPGREQIVAESEDGKQKS